MVVVLLTCADSVIVANESQLLALTRRSVWARVCDNTIVFSR